MDWSIGPSLSQNYSAFVSSIAARDEDCAKAFDGTGSNLPDATFKFNSGTSKFEVWSSASTEWNDAATKYNVNVSTAENLSNKPRDVFCTNPNGIPNISDNPFQMTQATYASNTWQGVGPTGASTVWTPLNSLPSDVDWIEVNVANQAFWENTADTGTMYVQTRKRGSSDPGTANFALWTFYQLGGAGSGVQGGHSHQETHKIAVSALEFDILWARVGVSAVTTFALNMHLVGYGYNP